MPSKNHVCAYNSCGSAKSRDPELTFHRFPNDAATRLKWIERCKNEKLAGLTEKQLDNYRVCSRHFPPEHFKSYGRQGKRKIKDFCVPHDDAPDEHPVFPPGEHSPPQTYDATRSSQESPPIINESPILIASILDNPTDNNNASVHLPLQQPVINQDILSVPDTDEAPVALGNPNKQHPREKGSSTVTPNEARQAQLIKLLRDEIKICKQKIRRMEKKDAEKAHLVDFARSVESLHTSQQEFIQMQLDHRKKKPWSEAEKQSALALFYVSPKAYSHLKDKVHIALPCVSLIRRWINELDLSTGISQGVFDRLATKVGTMSDDERECVIMWDEVALKKLLEYNSKADLVEGYEDLGELGRTNKVASHALTFMIRGLKYSWKQPIAFYLAHSSVRNEDLSKIIVTVMEKVQSIGLVIKAAVCDQGATNRTAIASLGVTAEKPFIISGSQKIYFMYDVPHLIKSVRNNMAQKKVFDIDGDKVSWEPISELRDLERDRACKAAPKLTDRHINPNTFDKMSVSLATQIFSASVSAALNAAHHSGEIQHPHCSATANFCKRINDLFDCLNSRSSSDPNPLKRALSSKQPQVQDYLEFSLSWIEKWKIAGSESTLPCVSGLIMTIKSVLQLWEDLRQSGTSYLITSRLNQDPLENLFSILRGRGGYNPAPSALSFRRNLQYAMTANLMKPSSSSNCEPDDATALLPMLENRERNEGLASGVKTDFRTEIDALVNQDSFISDPIPDPDDMIPSREETDEWAPHAAFDSFPINGSTVDNPLVEADNSVNIEEIDSPNTLHSEIDQAPIAGCSNDEDVVDNRIEHRRSIDSDSPLDICSLENCAKTYVAGYLFYKSNKKFNCSECSVALAKSNQNYEKTSELLIFWKAYRCKDNFELGHLKAPTAEFSRVTATMYNVFTDVFSIESHRNQIKKHLETCIHNALSVEHADFWSIEGPCREHRNYIVELFARVHIFNKLKWISRDLRDICKSNRFAKASKRPAGSYKGVKPNAKLKKITHQ